MDPAENPAADAPQAAPRLRHALKVVVPASGPSLGAVTVIELKSSLTLTIEAGGLQRDIALTVPEARALADHLRRICRRIVTRPDWRP